MEPITRDIRLATYKKAPEHVQEMYGSPETGDLLAHLIGEYHIHAVDTFVNLIGDIMLGFYPKSNLRKLLTGLVGVSEEAAVAIEKDLGVLLSKIDGESSVPPAPKDVREELELRPAGVPSNTPPREVPVSPSGVAPGGQKPLTREEVLRAITPKRTMASDIESVREEKERGRAPFGDTR